MSERGKSWITYFNKFESSINEITLPKQFTFPFNYQAHELCKIASTQLQKQLKENPLKGKMYGVLVVETSKNKLGFLAAVSGNNTSDESFSHFVPPVYDISNENEFFKKGEKELTSINQEILKIQQSDQFKNAIHKRDQVNFDAQNELNKLKLEVKTSKKEREKRRKQTESHLNESEIRSLLETLIKESQRQKSQLNQQKKYWKDKIAFSEKQVQQFTSQIQELKTERKTKSANLQERLFRKYRFINANGTLQDLLTIFENIQKIPPAAAGECAAPKLLQFAFKHKLRPIAMAEFWWGPPPKSEIRKQGYYYPACQSKCKPILGHMLKGLNVEPDPMDVNKKPNNTIDIVYEDSDLLVIHKPHGLLSVPGKGNDESIYSLIKTAYPKATGPLIVHRLDMATSGLMLIALTKHNHEHLQKQFLNHTIQKQYIALLDGLIENNEGIIELPLRVDLDNRPRQLVCYEYGKPARTKWQVIAHENDKTRVLFSPITGRTHQLRVHAAHQKGLNAPIVGDELYGVKAKRMCLQAQSIRFIHPKTQMVMRFNRKAEF